MFDIIKLIVRHLIRVNFNIKSFINFVYLNFISKHVENDYKRGHIIVPYPGCVFELRKGSKIIIDGVLLLGLPSIRKSKKSSYLFMNENAVWHIHGKVSIVDGCDIQIHQNALCEMNQFHSNTGLEISCGNHVAFEGEVTCGRHVRVKDFNGHYVSYEGYPKSAPVKIMNHTWLCTGSTINPGVLVGEGSVVGDNANVVNNIPSNTFSAGNPSKIIAENIEFKI